MKIYDLIEIQTLTVGTYEKDIQTKIKQRKETKYFLKQTKQWQIQK